MIGLTAQQMVYEAKIFYEDIASNNAPSFTNREWSVILTNAQAQIVQEIYDSGYDNNEENRLAIQNLLKQDSITEDEFADGALTNSYIIELPSDLMYMTYEECDGKQVRVMSYDSYFTNIFNPFKKPSNSVIWRLIGIQGSNILISNTKPELYKYIYIERPWPIIVTDLLPKQAIEVRDEVELYEQADCKLHPNVHRKIASTAAKIAFASVQEQAGYQIQSLESNKT